MFHREYDGEYPVEDHWIIGENNLVTMFYVVYFVASQTALLVIKVYSGTVCSLVLAKLHLFISYLLLVTELE